MMSETLSAALRRAATEHPSVIAIHFHGRDHSYATWDAAADRFARALLAAGVRRGDRLVLLLPPIPQYLFCYLGAARIGAITAGISTRYRRQEIGEILANADPRLVVSVGEADGVDFPALIASVRERAPSLERLVRLDGDGPESLAAFEAVGAAAGVDLDARRSDRHRLHQRDHRHAEGRRVRRRGDVRADAPVCLPPGRATQAG